MFQKAVGKDSKMLKLVHDYIKNQEMFEKFVRKSLFAIIHVPDQHKTLQICKKVISKSSGML